MTELVIAHVTREVYELSPSSNPGGSRFSEPRFDVMIINALEK